MRELKEIEANIAANKIALQIARDTLAGLERRNNELLLERDQSKHGVTVGSIVKCSFGICRVVSIGPNYWRDRPLLMVNRKNKDGSWSKQLVRVYGSWEIANE